MKMTPMKKLVLCIAAVSVAITVITTNILTSVFTLKAAQNNIARDNAISQQIAAHNASSGSSSNSGNNGGSSNNSGYVPSTPTTPVGGGSSQGTQAPQATQPSQDSQAPQDNQDAQAPQDNQGSQDTQTPDNTDKTPVEDNGDNGSQDAGATEQDGVKMYVDALNKAKTSASKVTRVRTNASNYKGHVEAGFLSSIAKSLMGTFMKEDTTPVDMDKNDLPPKGINCTLSNDVVESADVQKDGDNTIITIVTKAESNPKAGSGIGSAISIIEEKTITDAVEGVIEISNIKLDYDPCTIKATLDASGNLVGLYVQAPCILSLTAMGIDAEVGIDCEDEFVIAY